MVVLSPHEAVALPLAVLFFALGAMTLYPMPARGQGRDRRTRERPNRGVVWLTIAVAAVFGTVVAIPVTEVAVQAAVTGRGYVTCPYIGERHGLRRWLRPDVQTVRCPTAIGQVQ